MYFVEAHLLGVRVKVRVERVERVRVQRVRVQRVRVQRVRVSVRVRVEVRVKVDSHLLKSKGTSQATDPTPYYHNSQILVHHFNIQIQKAKICNEF